MLPRYPIYIPSKGRSHTPLTIQFLLRDGVPFRVVVNADERDAYAEIVGERRLLILPEPEAAAAAAAGSGLIFARNWIKQHSIDEGHERHWQLDDNIADVRRLYRERRIPCNSGPAFACIEDFCDRYENVAIAGMNYQMFVIPYQRMPPFHLNCHVYSCTLVLNSLPHRWRLRYNDDTDMCLQVLADGWCTVLFNVFMADKQPTMQIRGGNTDDLYQGDGRLRMARDLERAWPGVVTTSRRFGRPQHVVKDSWKKFDTPLKLKPGVDLAALAAKGPDEYGLRLEAVKPIRTPGIQRIYDESRRHGD